MVEGRDDLCFVWRHGLWRYFVGWFYVWLARDDVGDI